MELPALGALGDHAARRHRPRVIGGNSAATTVLAGAEVYDPTRDAWTAVPKQMSTGRASHTATLLQDGRVLVLGGRDAASFGLSSAEVYDPATGAWTTVASASTPIFGHTATLLAGNQVLVVGGVIGDGAQIYDASGDVWTSVASMSATRQDHTASLLPGGTVLVAGGDAGGTCEAYDPVSHAWTPVYTLNAPRHHCTPPRCSRGAPSSSRAASTAAGTILLDSADLFTPQAAGARCAPCRPSARAAPASTRSPAATPPADVGCTTCSIAYGARCGRPVQGHSPVRRLRVRPARAGPHLLHRVHHLRRLRGHVRVHRLGRLRVARQHPARRRLLARRRAVEPPRAALPRAGRLPPGGARRPPPEAARAPKCQKALVKQARGPGNHGETWAIMASGASATTRLRSLACVP